MYVYKFTNLNHPKRAHHMWVFIQLTNIVNTKPNAQKGSDPKSISHKTNHFQVALRKNTKQTINQSNRKNGPYREGTAGDRSLPQGRQARALS